MKVVCNTQKKIFVRAKMKHMTLCFSSISTKFDIWKNSQFQNHLCFVISIELSTVAIRYIIYVCNGCQKRMALSQDGDQRLQIQVSRHRRELPANVGSRSLKQLRELQRCRRSSPERGIRFQAQCSQPACQSGVVLTSPVYTGTDLAHFSVTHLQSYNLLYLLIVPEFIVK